jgi:hypothetical protein
LLARLPRYAQWVRSDDTASAPKLTPRRLSSARLTSAIDGLNYGGVCAFQPPPSALKIEI